ncbi:MAG: tetratricopeptide repeat protein, partial [Desulfobacterales bacterium]|nr:tetratricopeptide repeat protein [Desulfobacterales bacterium]
KGGFLMQKGDKKAAEAELKRVMELDPDNMKAYFALARIYLTDDREEEAIAQYKALLEKDPHNAAPHMMLGIIYYNNKQLDLSEEHYRKALEIDPDFVPAANNLAYMLVERGKDLNVALGYAQKAKENAPDNPLIMDTLGSVYYKKGLYDSAIYEFTDCLVKRPDDPTVHYHLGLALHKKGDKARARSALEKALELNKNFAEADEARRVLEEL